jgi:hypothetical protein
LKLNCRANLITDVVGKLQGVGQVVVLEAETLTPGGMQGVRLILESGLSEVLEAIAFSKAKPETRKMAMQVLKRLAAAGFKLAVMLELAPQQLKAQVDRHVEELEILKLKKEVAIAEQKLLDTKHYIVTALPEPVQQKILGYKEIKTTEYIDRTIGADGSVNDGVGITYIQKRYGFKSTKEAWGWLETIGMGKYSDIWQHQLKAVESAVLPREYVGQLDAMFDDSPRQRWLGE